MAISYRRENTHKQTAWGSCAEMNEYAVENGFLGQRM